MTQREFLKFKKELIELPNYKKLIQEFDPDIVYLGGSRTLNAETENSDYDLIAIAPESKKLNTLIYRNIFIGKADGNTNTIHCFVTTVKYIINVLLNDYSTPSNVFLLNALSNGLNKIDTFAPIMEKTDDKCTELFRFIKYNKIKIAEMSFFGLIEKLETDLDVICNEEKMNLSKKIYYQLLVIYDVFKSLDSSELIKKLRTDKLTIEDKQEIKTRMKELNTIYKSYKDSDYDALRAQLEVLRYGE